MIDKNLDVHKGWDTGCITGLHKKVYISTLTHENLLNAVRMGYGEHNKCTDLYWTWTHHMILQNESISRVQMKIRQRTHLSKLFNLVKADRSTETDNIHLHNISWGYSWSDRNTQPCSFFWVHGSYKNRCIGREGELQRVTRWILEQEK